MRILIACVFIALALTPVFIRIGAAIRDYRIRRYQRQFLEACRRHAQRRIRLMTKTPNEQAVHDIIIELNNRYPRDTVRQARTAFHSIILQDYALSKQLREQGLLEDVAERYGRRDR